jgi:hypothetical protein
VCPFEVLKNLSDFQEIYDVGIHQRSVLLISCINSVNMADALSCDMGAAVARHNTTESNAVWQHIVGKYATLHGI